MIERRGFLKAFALLVAAPALVRAESLMPVKLWVPPKVGPIYGLIYQARAFFDSGARYHWVAAPGQEIALLPGQDVLARFDESIKVRLGRREYLEVQFEEGGRYYTKFDGQPPIPADAGSPPSRFQ